ncbi:hypothetical protein FNV43_RR15022 [Rhamnella rubrinervis]|uniref:Uncharacterized protein n=1 Tax=Rhamnella rubrinervis TaxID=2594499 RepID=A0A8K0EC91_9ROSA|nr:hypothetical protein FNV43_RR15022 [Rhamnella rubrinervis]
MNADEESAYKLNDDIPIPPKKKERAKKNIEMIEQEYAYYQQENTPNFVRPSFDHGQPSYSSHSHDTHMHDMLDMPMGEGSEKRDCQLSVIERNCEVQYVIPSKVTRREPRVMKCARKMKSPFIVITETQEQLKNTLPPPDNFDPKRVIRMILP